MSALINHAAGNVPKGWNMVDRMVLWAVESGAARWTDIVSVLPVGMHFPIIREALRHLEKSGEIITSTSHSGDSIVAVYAAAPVAQQTAA